MFDLGLCEEGYSRVVLVDENEGKVDSLGLWQFVAFLNRSDRVGTTQVF